MSTTGRSVAIICAMMQEARRGYVATTLAERTMSFDCQAEVAGCDRMMEVVTARKTSVVIGSREIEQEQWRRMAYHAIILYLDWG